MSPAALRRLGLVLLWSASLGGIAYGLHRLEPYARDATGDGSWHLEWVGVPPAVDDWILREVEQERTLYDLRPLLETDVHAPDLCARLAAELARSPWIAEVERVSKWVADEGQAGQPGGTVSVHAKFRQYLTYVVKGGIAYLVDAAGVRLNRIERPSYLEAHLDEHHMILVEGVRAPVPAVGQSWPGGDVAAGLKLVRFLQEHEGCPAGLRASLRAVDVSNFEDRLNRREGWLRIRTIHPTCPVFWGLPPGQEYDIECTGDQKLGYLWRLYCQYGQLPDLGRPIDVRPKDSIDFPEPP